MIVPQYTRLRPRATASAVKNHDPPLQPAFAYPGMFDAPSAPELFVSRVGHTGTSQPVREPPSDETDAEASQHRRKSPDPWWRLRPSDQQVLAVLVLIASGLMAAWCWSNWRISGELVDFDRLPQRDAAFRVDVNNAPWPELAQLPQVGEELARRIVLHRDEHGPFAQLEDLQEVEGIGERRFERLRPYLLEIAVKDPRINEPERGTIRQMAPREEGPTAAEYGEPLPPDDERIDLNRATAAELDTLHGIGPALAERIIASREADGPFRSVEDLDRVSGIGEKTVEKLRASAKVSN